VNFFRTVWNNDCSKEEDILEEEKTKTFNSSFEILKDYSEYSTIQGLIYIFFSYQTTFGRIFWIVVVLLMLMLGLYWCIQAYQDWKDKPVLTTITTTTYPINKVSHKNEINWKNFRTGIVL
jgi:hypothetical protein